MSRARLVITAVIIAGPHPGRGRPHLRRLSEAWVSRLMARYRAEGDGRLRAPVPAPKTSPRRDPNRAVDLILRLRKQLLEAGLDAGPDTHRLAPRPHHHGVTLSRATITGS